MDVCRRLKRCVREILQGIVPKLRLALRDQFSENYKLNSDAIESK